MAKAHPLGIRVITVDVDEAPEIAREYQVRNIPYLVLIRDGKTVNEHVGYADRTDLTSWAELDRSVSSSPATR